MSVQYQRMNEDDKDDDVCQSPTPLTFPNGSGGTFTQVVPRWEELRWPTAVGAFQIVLGLLIALLGLCEVLILPMVEDHTATVQFNKATCYGVPLYAGLLMVISGSMAIRASLSRRKTTVYKFYHLEVMTLLVYAALTVFLIVSYSQYWMREQTFPTSSTRSQVHLVVTLLMLLGLTIALTTVIHYRRAVCFGQVQLWHWWTHCICNACSAESSESPSERERLVRGTDGKSGPVALLV